MNASAGTLEKAACIALAGDVSMRRSLRGSEPGWARHRMDEELIAFHESGHAVVALALGGFAYYVSVTPDHDLLVGRGGHFYAGGQALTGFAPADLTSETGSGQIASDRERVAWLCLTIAGADGWRGAVRLFHQYRRATVGLVEKHWGQIVDLAVALQGRLELTQAEIETVTGLRGHLQSVQASQQETHAA